VKENGIGIEDLCREEYSLLQAEFKELMNQYYSGDIASEKLFSVFLDLYKQEEEAMDEVRKTIITDQLDLLDVERNCVFRGFVDRVKSTSNCINDDVHRAAIRLKVLLEQYGNITRRYYDQKTTAFNKLIQEITVTSLANVYMVGLAPWTLKLDDKNKAFDALMRLRYEEVATRTGLKVELVRFRLDTVYRNMSDLLNAQIRKNVAIKYKLFVKCLKEHEQLQYDSQTHVGNGKI